MQDQSFEEQVHRKLENMHLRPSEAVWEKVEQQISSRKKRRRILIWLPLLVLCCTCGLWLHDTPVTSPVTVVAQKSTHPSLQQEPAAPAIVLPQLGHHQNSTFPFAGSNTIVSGSRNTITSAYHNNGNIKHNIEEASSADTSGPTVQDVTVAMQPHPLAASADKNNNTPHDDLYTVDVPAENGKQPNPDSVVLSAPVSNPDSAMIATDARAVMVTNSVIPVENTIAIPSVMHAPGNIATTDKRQRLKSWHWMFTAGYGTTGISTSPFSINKNNMALADAIVTTVPGAVQVPAPSAVHPGKGFSAGVQAARHITKRIMWSAGLQYAFLTNSIITGSRSDSMVLLRPPANNFSAQVVQGYYRTGTVQQYTNKIHLLELPVQLRVRLTGSRRLPLFWDGGLSVSRIVATNTLQYNSQARVYVQSDKLINRTQLNATTGFSIGLFTKYKFPVMAGPHIMYGITKYNTAAAGRNHLYFLSVKAAVSIH